MAQLLPSDVTSINVVRAALLSIVLTLAAGPDTALFCITWCQSGEGMPTSCERQMATSSRSVTVDENCKEFGTPPFVREGRQTTTDVQRAIIAARLVFTELFSDVRRVYEPATTLPHNSPHLALALRI